MNPFEKALLALLTAAPGFGPVVLHSQHGVLVLNASEQLASALFHQFGLPVLAAPTTAVGTPPPGPDGITVLPSK